MPLRFTSVPLFLMNSGLALPNSKHKPFEHMNASSIVLPFFVICWYYRFHLVFFGKGVTPRFAAPLGEEEGAEGEPGWHVGLAWELGLGFTESAITCLSAGTAMG